MPKKKGNEPKKKEQYACACGSTSFIEEGLANFREEITISASGVLEGGCPEIDVLSSDIKCAQCGAEYNP